MPTIQEQLELINGKFAQLHAEFARIDGDAAALQEEKRNARNRAHAKLKARYDAIAQDRENVDMFYRIARENTKADLPSNAAPARPDIAKLNEIASQVNSYNRTDPSAARIVELAAGYFAWLDVEQGKLDKEAEQLLTNDVGRIEGSEGALAAKRSRMIITRREHRPFRGLRIGAHAVCVSRVSRSRNATSSRRAACAR